MPAISDVVIDYLVEREIPHVHDRDTNVIGFLSASERGSWTVYVAMLEADDQVVVHSTFNPPVPEDRREAMALFLTRANFGILHGNFELDLDDGDVRYKTSLDLRGVELSEPLFENLVVANVAMFDRWVPGIEAVVHGTEPIDAVSVVEGDADSGH